MSAYVFGQFGGDNEERPFVTLDDEDFPLTPESIVEGAPLNPFSPSNADGNSVAVVSQRHASEVWDDLTAGLGFRDDEPGSHQYALGNLDVRAPGGWVPPPLAGNLASGAAAATPYTNNSTPVVAKYLQDGTGNYDFICWENRTQGSATKVRGIRSTGVRTVGIPDTDIMRALAEYNGAWWALTNDGTNSKLWNMTALGGSFTLVNTAAFVSYYGLVMYDNKLITAQAGGGVIGPFLQWSGTAWVSYIGTMPPLAGSETLRQLFVWTDKSGSRDALYALTTRRLMVYDEDGEEWSELYRFSDLFVAPWSTAHVNRRDNSLVLSVLPDLAAANTVPTGNLLLFTPGTADNIPINKGLAFPTSYNYGGSYNAPSTAYPAVLVSGIHWLYAFCYAPSTVAGDCGGVYAFNEFGGWTQVYDPVVASGGSNRLIGGGYGGGVMLTLLGNGAFHITTMPDAQLNPPFGTYDSRAAGSGHDYFVRSGRIYNKQKNIKKLGSHVEVTFKDPIPTGHFVGQGTVYLTWRYFNEQGLSAWHFSDVFHANAQRVSVNLTDQAGSNGIHYYYMEWELHVYMPEGSDTPPVVESVVLYYTYFQTNRYAYSFNIDLTAETWKEFYPDGTFHGKTREYLQTRLLAMMDETNYHAFSYSQLFFTESVTRADCSLARRESSDDASGIYSMTVRDLEPDAAAGVFYAG